MMQEAVAALTVRVTELEEELRLVKMKALDQAKTLARWGRRKDGYKKGTKTGGATML